MGEVPELTDLPLCSVSDVCVKWCRQLHQVDGRRAPDDNVWVYVRRGNVLGEDAGTIISDLGAIRNSLLKWVLHLLDVLTLKVVISKLKCHRGCPPYIGFGPPEVALPVM